ncbi:hypothetical protein GWI34_28830 [Actinomadura sp. DSM 109109]|nr:hypothetical protein [Actinomadura lepetitiana]
MNALRTTLADRLGALLRSLGSSRRSVAKPSHLLVVNVERVGFDEIEEAALKAAMAHLREYGEHGEYVNVLGFEAKPDGCMGMFSATVYVLER